MYSYGFSRDYGWEGASPYSRSLAPPPIPHEVPWSPGLDGISVVGDGRVGRNDQRRAKEGKKITKWRQLFALRLLQDEASHREMTSPMSSRGVDGGRGFYDVRADALVRTRRFFFLGSSSQGRATSSQESGTRTIRPDKDLAPRGYRCFSQILT